MWLPLRWMKTHHLLLRTMDLTRTKGIFLSRAIRRVESKRTELLAAMAEGDLNAIRNIKVRIKRATYRQLYEEEVKRAGQTMTVAEFQRRKEQAKSFNLMDIVIKASEQSLRTREATPEVGEELGHRTWS